MFGVGMTYVRGDTYEVINVTPGIVRNLLKTTYYLRIPRQEVNKGQKQGRDSQTIPLLPGVDTVIFWKDFDIVSNTLKQLDRDSIVKIIQYPKHNLDDSTSVGVQKDGTTIVPAVKFIDFHGDVLITDEGSSVAGVTINPTGVAWVEIPFAALDWVNNQIVIIPTGVPGLGQVGPHLLPVIGNQFVVNHFQTIDASHRRNIDMADIINITSGFITVFKAPAASPFSGVFVVSVSLA